MTSTTSRRNSVIRFNMIQASYGDSLLIEDGSSGTVVRYLIDGGPAVTVPLTGDWKKVGYSLFLTLNGLDVQYLDFVVVTHNDKDHVNGICALLSGLGDINLFKGKKEITGLDDSHIDDVDGILHRLLVQWTHGYESLNVNKKFPIGRIWYNDLYYVSNKKTAGWCTKILNLLKDVYETNMKIAKIPAINVQTGTHPKSYIQFPESEETKLGIKVYGPRKKQMDVLEKDMTSDSYHYSWKTSLQELAKAVKNADKSDSNRQAKFAKILYDRWAKMTGKTQLDEEAKNLSSIMFEYNLPAVAKKSGSKDNNGKLLLTGDSTGEILYNSLKDAGITIPTDGTAPRRYRIMKVMHHGSSRNCWLREGVYAASKSGDGIKGGCFNFFLTFSADIYCISGDSFDKNPNPDNYVLEAICNAHVYRGEKGPVIAVTNTLSFEQVYNIMGDWSTGEKYDGTTHSVTPKILTLDRECDYGSIYPDLIDKYVFSTAWGVTNDVDATASHLRKAMNLGMEKFETTKLPALVTEPHWAEFAEYLKNNTAPDPEGPHIERPMGSNGRVRRKRYRDADAFVMAMTTGPMTAPEQFFTLASTTTPGMVGAMASTTPVPTTKPQHLDWHDVMAANLVSAGLFEMGDFKDTPIEPAVKHEDINRVEANYPQWVDMRSLALLIEEYNQGPPVGRQRRIPMDVIQRFKAWFGGVTADSNPAEIPVVAMFFLTQFLSRETMMKLFAQLPINHNGRLEDDILFSSSPSSTIAAIMALTIQNFRARVVLPTDAQRATGMDMLILSFHFELAPPLPGWSVGVKAEDVMQWSIPITNSDWQRGQIRLKHHGNVRVKILYPQYNTAVTFAFYDSTMTVYRDPLGLSKIADYEVDGKMISKSGSKEVASYDILLKVDNEDGTMNLLDLLRLWSPMGTTATMASAFAGSMGKIDLPGVDLPNLVTDALSVKDCGIILRQYTPWGVSIGLHDVYGTIDLGDKLKLAHETIGLPEFLANCIPQVPDLTITLSDVMLDDPQLSFAFGFTLPDDIGFTVLQIGVGADDNPRFDIWVVTNPDTNLSVLLSQLGLDNLFQDFDKAAVFTDALALATIPFTQITISTIGSAPRSKGTYGMEKLAFMIEVGTFHIPSESNPILIMEEIQLVFERLNPASLGGSPSIKVFGEAKMTIKDIDAELTFAVDPGLRKSEAFLDDEVEEFKALGPAQDYILIQVTFPGETPSFGDILSHLVGDVGIVTDVTDTVPTLIKDVFLEVLNLVGYREIAVEVARTSVTPQKWRVEKVTVSVILAKDILKRLNDALDGILVFEAPTLTITVLNPSDKLTREWNVFMNGYVVLAGTLVEVQASFFKPPEGLLNIASEFGLIIQCGVTGGPGIPVGEILLDLADAAISESTVSEVLPETLQDVIESVEVTAIRVSFSEDPVTRKYKVKWLEAVINVARDETLVIVDDFAISDIILHVTHSTGVGTVADSTGAMVPLKNDTSITLDGKLQLGPKNILSAAISHSTGTGAWTAALTDSNSDGLDIVDLVLTSLPDILAFELPKDMESTIRDALKINISSFFISYQPARANQVQRLIFSQDGEISLFGVGSQSLRLILERAPPQSWDWTLAVKLPSPCYPFKGIFGGSDVLGLNGVAIFDGYISVASGAPSSIVTAMPYVAPIGPKELSLALSGRIILKDSAAFKLIADIVKVTEVDFMIAVPKPVLDISIPTGGENGIKIMNVFIMNDFRLRLETPGKMSLGASFTLNASWFSKTPVTAAMFITFEPTAIGAIFNMGNIEAPFGMEFLYMEDTRFALAWLLTGVGPKSLAVKAGIKIKPPGATEAMRIEASFDCGFDATNPAANYLIMRAAHITLKDIVMALMAARSLPAPLDSDNLNIGFERLKVDIVPISLQYSVEAKFFFFFLRGQILASATATELRFASTLDKVDVLGLIKVTSAHDTNIGPFCYLDVTANSITSGKGTPPKWLDAQVATDPNLQDAIFALTGHVVLLGKSIKAYGYVSDRGLHLALVLTNDISPIPAIAIRAGAEMEIIIDNDRFFGSFMLHLDIEVTLSKIDVLDVGLGALDFELASFDAGMSIQVTYRSGVFQEHGLVYRVHVHVELAGIDAIDGDVELSVSVQELEDIPDVVKGFIEDEIKEGLENKVLEPIKDVLDDIEEGIEHIGDETLEGINTAINGMRTGINIGAHELINVLIKAGYGIELIAHILKTELDMTIAEVASEFIQFGEDVNKVAQVIADTFEAFPNEVASGLISAGVAIEHAFESAFDDIGKEVSGAVNLIGSSIAGFGEDVIDAVVDFFKNDVKDFFEDDVKDFFEDDVKDFFEDVGGAIIDGVADVADDIGNWFEDTCVVA